jgi:sodium transport system permease protein
MIPFLAVVWKEMVDGLRDYRSLVTAAGMPVLMPILMVGLISQFSDDLKMGSQTHVNVRGVENAPDLIAYMRLGDVVVHPSDDATEDDVRQGRLKHLLSIPDDYGADLQEGKARVFLYRDEGKPASEVSAVKVSRLLGSYEDYLVRTRLSARGVAPVVINPLRVVRSNVAESQDDAMSGIMMSLVTMFVITSAFTSSMYLSIETSVGERERRSLEPLILCPVPRSTLVVGKWCAALFFAQIGLTLSIVVAVAAFSWLPLHDMDVQHQLNAATCALVALVSLPLAGLASSCQLSLASFTRSLKEAQMVLSFTVFAPMLPTIGSMVTPLSGELWMKFIPILSHHLVIVELLQNGSCSWADAALATVACLVPIPFLLGLAIWQFGRESILG